MQKLIDLKDLFLSWSLKKKLLIGATALVTSIILFILLLFLSVKWELITDLPSKDELLLINNPLSTEIYSKEGNLFGTFFDENRGDLTSDDLTEDYKNALIATEDVRFYKHHGLDYRALMRVIVKSILLQRDNSGGGSTLTQQLSKNLYPRKRFWLLSLPINKFREICIAQKLEKTYSKDEILLLYSNTVSFGERAFGLYTASNRFFGKKPKDLSLEESATLVGILKAPTYYSPRKNPERCEKRRNTVLSQMQKYNFLTEEEAETAISNPLELKYKSLNEITGLAKYFHQFIRKEFEAWAADHPKENGELYNIKRDGLKIYTTLNYNLQIAAELAMNSHMSKLQKIFENSWKGGKIFGSSDKYLITELQADPYFKELKNQGKTESEIIEIFQRESLTSVWNWGDTEVEVQSKYDSLKHYVSLLHTGILAADPRTGNILVYVGGNDYGEFQWDNIQSPRQVGSTFKPIVYLTALERGASACDYFPNELRTYSSYEDWTPENSEGTYGGYLSLKSALTHSTNTVSVQMIFQAGIDNVIKQAKRLGITSKLPAVPSLVLGTADISLFEMVKAYSGIANNGISPNLHGISRIENSKGEVLYENNPKSVAKEANEAYGMLHAVLANVVNEGTGSRLYNYDIPFQVMGKTGTTQNQTDGWFIGYTKEMVVGAWVGAQNRGIHFRNLGTGSGGRTALPLVASVFEHAANQKFRPAPIDMALLSNCPDSIGQSEFEYLKEHPNEFDRIYAARNRDSFFDNIFRTDFPPNENDNTSTVPKRRRRSNDSQKNERMSDFEKFRQKVEKDLKKIFNNKRRKN